MLSKESNLAPEPCSRTPSQLTLSALGEVANQARTQINLWFWGTHNRRSRPGSKRTGGSSNPSCQHAGMSFELERWFYGNLPNYEVLSYSCAAKYIQYHTREGN